MADTDDCTAERLSWVFEFLHWADLDDLARVFNSPARETTGLPVQYLVDKLHTAGHDAARFWSELDKPNRARLCRLAREKYQPAAPFDLAQWTVSNMAECLGGLEERLYRLLIDFEADWDRTRMPLVEDLWDTLTATDRQTIAKAWLEETEGDHGKHAS